MQRFGYGLLWLLGTAALSQCWECGEPDGIPNAPYAPPLKASSNEDWLSVRADLIGVIFGTNPKEGLPKRAVPDHVEPIFGPQQEGCACSKLGHCAPEECAWDNNMTKIIWTMEAKVNNSYTLRINSTVFHTLNTSGVAPLQYPPLGPPQMPGKIPSTRAFPAKHLSDTLLIFHHGHAQPCDICDVDHNGFVDWVILEYLSCPHKSKPGLTAQQANQLGYDTMEIQMPLHQCNYIKESGCDHSWFQQWEDQGVPTIKFFLEPVVLSINYARSLGYKRIIMAGLSGGGWTTTLMAAIDPRIQLSFPVAGSAPCDFNHTSWDYEQFCGQPWAQVANYTSLYVLAALESDRYSVQVIHEQDPCCFHGCGRHPAIRKYNKWVQSQIQGRFATSPTVGNLHEVNERDKVIIASLMDKLRVSGELSASDFTRIPFNTLDEW